MYQNTNKERPLVTVGIPSYNRPEMLRRAISSALAQTYSNLEVVVSDDASTDSRTIRVIEEFSSNPRFRYQLHEDNVGLVRNFQQSLELADGDFWLCLPNDDWLEPDAIEQMMGCFTSGSIGLVICGQCIHSEKRDRIKETPREGAVSGVEFIKDRLASKCGFPPTELYRTELARACGGYQDIGFAMDMLLELKTGKRADIAYINRPLLHHNSHEMTASRSQAIKVMQSMVSLLEVAQNQFNDREIVDLIYWYCVRSLRRRTWGNAFLKNHITTALGVKLLKQIGAPEIIILQAQFLNLRVVQESLFLLRCIKRRLIKMGKKYE